MSRIHAWNVLGCLAWTLPLLVVGQEPKTEDKPEPPKKKEVKPAENVVYGTVWKGCRLKKVDGPDFFSVEKPAIDPQKYQAYLAWEQQQIASISRNFNPVSKAQAMASFQQQKLQRQQQIYSLAEVGLKANENLKIRSLEPPVEYDDKGNLKKYTPKELSAMKGSGKLPGYAIEFVSLREGQIVDVYLPKSPATKTVPGKKKDDDAVLAGARQEVVMIVVTRQK